MSLEKFYKTAQYKRNGQTCSLRKVPIDKNIVFFPLSKHSSNKNLPLKMENVVEKWVGSFLDFKSL